MADDTTTIELSLSELREVAGYAVACARPVLAIFERDRPDDRRPRAAIDAAQAFADGARRTKAIRDGAWAAHRAAQEARDAGQAAASDAARAAAGAASSAFLHPLAKATQVKHILGSAAYAARAFERSAGDDPTVGAHHIAHVRILAPPAVVDVLRRFPVAPAGGGRVEELIRELDASLRDPPHPGPLRRYAALMPRSSMRETTVDELRSSFERLLAIPTPDDLWALQKALLIVGGAGAARARGVARAFHACLRTLDSKSASRTASRWGAVLGTAAVGSVSLPELRDRQERGLAELLERALPAVLEIGAALRTAEAWEIEARLIYDEFAWFLYEELWDVSTSARPDLAAAERRQRIDELLDPLLDPGVPDIDRATLLVDIFRSVLAARVLPLLGEAPIAAGG